MIVFNMFIVFFINFRFDLNSRYKNILIARLNMFLFVPNFRIFQTYLYNFIILSRGYNITINSRIQLQIKKDYYE